VPVIISAPVFLSISIGTTTGADDIPDVVAERMPFRCVFITLQFQSCIDWVFFFEAHLDFHFLLYIERRVNHNIHVLTSDFIWFFLLRTKYNRWLIPRIHFVLLLKGAFGTFFCCTVYKGYWDNIYIFLFIHTFNYNLFVGRIVETGWFGTRNIRHGKRIIGLHCWITIIYFWKSIDKRFACELLF